jgi:hypothetical protein
MHHTRKIHRWFAVLMLFNLILAACRSSSSVTTAPGIEVEITPSAQSSPDPQTALPETTPTVPVPQTPTPTIASPLALLLAPQGSDDDLAHSLFSQLQAPLEQAGLRWEMRPSLDTASLGTELRLVVALPPDPGLPALAAAAPHAQFLAVGIPGLQPIANLSLLAADGQRPDQQGFMAGVIAAIITPDWRVGVLGPADTPAARAARQGFLNGAIYFCGLCLPYHGPSVDYPVYLDLPVGASLAEIQAAVQNIKDLAVKTVYVVPGSFSSDLSNALAQAEIKVLGAEAPPPELVSHWVATIQTDPLPAVLQALPGLLAGQGGQTLPVTLGMAHVNADLFSPGRQERAQEILSDLLAGFIDTGVDPSTGEPR